MKNNQPREKILSGQKLDIHDTLHFILLIIKTVNEANCLIISSLALSQVSSMKNYWEEQVSKWKKKLEYEHNMSANSRRAGFSRIVQEIG